MKKREKSIFEGSGTKHFKIELNTFQFLAILNDNYLWKKHFQNLTILIWS